MAEDYISDFTGSQIDGLLNKENSVNDYVIEKYKGGTEEWSYVKFNGGITILWGAFKLYPTESNKANDYSYYSELIYLSLPFKVGNAIITGVVGDRHHICNASGSWANQNICFRLDRASPIVIPSGNYNLWGQFIVTGWWK